MSIDDEQKGFKITLEDLEAVHLPESRPEALQPATGERSYGSIADASGVGPAFTEEKGSFLLQGWFYLGVAGLLGALAGWGICEPFFVDAPQSSSWGSILIVPLILTLMSVGFGVAESVVERSPKKAMIRGLLSLPLGVVLGFIFYFVANIIFAIGISICAETGVQSNRSPAFWLVRGLAWMVFGTAGGIIYGIIGQSFKKGLYGAIGGMIGAGIGGMIFDPIAMATHGGAPSRAVGFALVGVVTGVGMGLVESALKDRWLYVVSGPLAGKQFILYKPQTVIGSAQQSDLYLFKDSSILPQHALISLTGARMMLRAMGPVHVSGNTVQSRILQDGDLLQIGRYAFRYKEKLRS